MSSAAQPQPPPRSSNSRPIIDLVCSDFVARAEMGREKYGMYLRANNGRDALWDAYQEAIDLCMYLRQEIEERKP